MRRTDQKEISARLERYELKYQIPASMIDPISDYLSIYCSLDQYSEKAQDGFYAVNSLYFDSPRFLFLKRRMLGAENRFNMRIRSYDCVSGMPCFFEIKQKRDGIIRKYRATVYDEDWPDIFKIPGYEPEAIKGREDKSNIDLFYRTACSYQATPKVMTRYLRKAYVSDVDDYGRATFDQDIGFQREDGYSLIPEDSRKVSCRIDTVFNPGCSVILELKCYASYVPQWMLALIRHFDLQRISFSKYLNSALHVLGNDVNGHSDRVPICERFC